MDTQGNAAARVDVAAIKLVAAQLQTRVLDRATQVFGARGLTPDTQLAQLWSCGRAMRFLDGPDGSAPAHHRAYRTRAREGQRGLDESVSATLDNAASGRPAG